MSTSISSWCVVFRRRERFGKCAFYNVTVKLLERERVGHGGTHTKCRCTDAGPRLYKTVLYRRPMPPISAHGSIGKRGICDVLLYDFQEPDIFLEGQGNSKICTKFLKACTNIYPPGHHRISYHPGPRPARHSRKKVGKKQTDKRIRIKIHQSQKNKYIRACIPKQASAETNTEQKAAWTNYGTPKISTTSG